MYTVTLFGAGTAAVLALLAAVLALALRPLKGSLRELCGAEERAAFWTAFSGVSMAVGAVLLALMGFWWGLFSPPDAQSVPFRALVQMLQGAIAGLLVGLAVIGAIVLAFTARLARGLRPSPHRE